jgi:hypothetical protein
LYELKKELKIKCFAKIRLYKLPAFTTALIPHRKIQIAVIYSIDGF